MLTYQIDDMSCGHCASTITKAVLAVDAGARVQADLSRHLVTVESAKSDAKRLEKAIAEAGYTPIRVEATPATNPSAKNGGCCGCCG